MEHSRSSFIRDTFRDRDFIRRVTAIGIPIMLQQLIVTAMYMVDTIMIGALGDIPLAGVGAANQLAYLLDIVLSGVTSGGSIYMSQYYGKKDIKGFRSTLGLTLIFCLGISIIFVLGASFFAPLIVGLYSKEQAVIYAGANYLYIACFGYIAKGVIYAYGIAHKSANNPKLPLFSGLTAILVNIFLNWCLIYGNLGFPALGLQGAAIATLIGSAVDVAILIFFSYYKDCPARARLHELLAQTVKGVKAFIKVGLPAFLSDALWALCMLAINWVYGQMGTDAFAATMIVNSMDKLTMVALMGIGNSSAVVVGNTLGEGDMERAYLYGRRSVFLSALVGVVVGLACCTGLPYIVNLYTSTSATVKQLAFYTIFASGFMMPIYAINYTIICGILRSGGDTKAAALIDIVPLWLLALPATAIGGLVFDLPLYWVYVCAFPSNLFRMFLALKRTKSASWARRLV